ncbi:MAG: hypothetical protein U0401_20145 [Anaerolineae bacterium]
MSVFPAIFSLLLMNLLGFTLPALLAAWLFTLVLPLPFDQMVWLSLAVLLINRYTLHTLTDMPGLKDTHLISLIVSVGAAFIFLALSGLMGWLLFLIVGNSLTLFETILLFAVTFSIGFYFTVRSGTGGLPIWMTMPELDEEDFEEDYIVAPPKKRGQRRRRTNKV